MKRLIREHVSYANVMATVAVFFAIGGGIVMAGAKNSVGAKELGKIAVRTAESPLTTDSDGTQNGAPGAMATAVATAKCKKGEDLLGGGAQWVGGNDGNDENLYVNESRKVGPRSWRAEGIVDFGAQGQARIQAQAICLTK